MNACKRWFAYLHQSIKGRLLPQLLEKFQYVLLFEPNMNIILSCISCQSEFWRCSEFLIQSSEQTTEQNIENDIRPLVVEHCVVVRNLSNWLIGCRNLSKAIKCVHAWSITWGSARVTKYFWALLIVPSASYQFSLSCPSWRKRRFVDVVYAKTKIRGWRVYFWPKLCEGIVTRAGAIIKFLKNDKWSITELW